MEELQTKTIDVSINGKTIACDLKERDFGDYIVYDVFSNDNYLFTISKEGDVLFNEADMTQQRTIMDPRDLNEVIEYIKDKVIMELK